MLKFILLPLNITSMQKFIQVEQYKTNSVLEFIIHSVYNLFQYCYFLKKYNRMYRNVNIK